MSAIDCEICCKNTSKDTCEKCGKSFCAHCGERWVTSFDDMTGEEMQTALCNKCAIGE